MLIKFLFIDSELQLKSQLEEYKGKKNMNLRRSLSIKRFSHVDKRKLKIKEEKQRAT